MLFQIGHDGLFAPVQRGVADPVNALIGLDLEGDEIASGAGHDDLGAGDFHASLAVLILSDN